VKYTDEILNLIAKICIDMNVDGHRAEIFMLKVAKTLAAYHLRQEITEEDVKEAAELVLSHRMRKKPFEESKFEKEKIEESIQKQKNKMQNNQREENHNNKSEEENKENKQDATSEVNFEIGDAFKVRNILAKTKEEKKGSGRRIRAKSDTKSGKYVRSEIPKKNKNNDIAIDATLRASAPYQLKRAKEQKSKSKIIIEPQDIRCKVREKKVENIILFLVDSSGSMGANRRMIETKGAILSLLIDAYQKRDKVGMVAFKGDKAELLLPPTQSVELAKKKLQVLPTGGKTPLSLGLLKALEILKAQKKKMPKSNLTLILITDGKANLSLGNKSPLEEAKEIAQSIKSEGIKSIVIDTESGFLKFGFAKDIARELNASYYEVEDLKSEFLINVIKETIN
jgi:magnesium chelatase subunit D